MSALMDARIDAACEYFYDVYGDDERERMRGVIEAADEAAAAALIERHASLLADAERSASKSRAHNLRTKASGVGEAIALLRSAAGVGT